MPVRHADPGGPVPRRDDRLERVDVAHLVAEDRDTTRSVARDEPFDRLALAAGLARTEIDDRAAAIGSQPVDEPEPALHGPDGLDDRGAGGRHVVGLAHVERHGRSLPLHEQPGR